MRMLLVKPPFRLSHETVAAWRTVDSTFLRRGDPSRLRDVAGRYPVVVNLGNSGVPEVDHPWLFNPKRVVDMARSQVASTVVLDEWMPWTSVDDAACLPWPVWMKGVGRRGRNKRFIPDPAPRLYVPPGWVVQKHVDGDEFRVNVVDDWVVQGHRRTGDDDNRQYEWCGTRDLPRGTVPTCKAAARAIMEQHDAHIVGAFDVIHDGEECHVLEFNTCPGMNEATAGRVHDMIGQLIEGGEQDAREH